MPADFGEARQERSDEEHRQYLAHGRSEPYASGVKLSSTLAAFAAFTAVLAGCETSAAPPSIGYAKVDLGSVSGAACQDIGPFLQVGNDYVGVADESTEGGASYGVECKVAPTADGKFDVIARAEKRGSGGGSLTIKGTMSAAGKQSNVAGAFQTISAFYSQADCTVEYLDNESISSGKIRGKLRCNNAVKSDVTVDVRCDATAEFQFENCVQR